MRHTVQKGTGVSVVFSAPVINAFVRHGYQEGVSKS